ncbi:MAG: hypothetical protein GC165_08815 [Armatimonadetes bacterium]|nr:hypothetical protein [Armatimonadota bacterium]MBS1728770.1 hypothetical protein [Armatimonadota bacterium]
MLAIFVALSSTTAQTFIAMPSSTWFVDDSGQVVDRLKVMFHELTFVQQNPESRTDFLLDGKLAVHTTSTNIYRRDGLIPVINDAHQRALWQRYAGKTVWAYGRQTLLSEGLGQSNSRDLTLFAGQPIVITGIYQLAKQDIEVGEHHSQHGNLVDSGFREAKNYGADFPILVVFQDSDKLRQLSFSSQSVASHYGPPFAVYVGEWKLEQVFSLTPPPASAQKWLKKNLWHPVPGMTHLDVAWVYGWPIEKKPLAEILKENNWDWPYFCEVDFRGDKVVEYDEHLPH